MRLASVPMAVLLTGTGTLYFSAILLLVVAEIPLGTPAFLALAAVMALAYGVLMARIWTADAGPRRLLYTALALGVLFRVPPAAAFVGPDSDMVRYLWDGRVQTLGYNPYFVRPADPALAYTHTAETAAMPSARARTPYPPAAQLFFRLVVTLRDSTVVMKLALVACDLATMAILWRWLGHIGRSQWLTLAYAWHPLVVLEIAHSGHIDALGAMWLAAAACSLARGRTALASVAFVLAVATKLLPIVLAPLFAGRVRYRDILLAAGTGVALYLPFLSGSALPFGAIPGVVAGIRFNGPLFLALAWATAPAVAAALAVLLGAGVAFWIRRRLPASDPAAWAWPMAVALLFAPVVYPWYLLSLTPFLLTPATLPLMAWTFSVLPIYMVWPAAAEGGRWQVPPGVLALEYLAVAVTLALVLYRLRGGRFLKC